MCVFGVVVCVVEGVVVDCGGVEGGVIVKWVLGYVLYWCDLLCLCVIMILCWVC